MEARGLKDARDGPSRTWQVGAGLTAAVAAALIAGNFVNTAMGGCQDTGLMTLTASVVALVTFAPLAVYLYKTAKREVPALVHMAGAYFAASLLAFSCFAHLYIDFYCHDAALRTWFFGLGATTFENVSFVYLAYMQVVKVRALESTGTAQGKLQRNISWIWYGILASAILKNASIPFGWVPIWSNLLGKDLIPDAVDMFNMVRFPEGWYFQVLAVSMCVYFVAWILYATSLSLLTYAAWKSMWRAQGHLKNNNDVASIYLRQMLTKNAWLTLLANIVSLSRSQLSLTCLMNNWFEIDGMPKEFKGESLMWWCVLDAVVNGSCILALSGLFSSSQNEQVLGFFSLANRLARLGHARKRVQEELGYDLGEKIKELEEPLTQSMSVYSNALHRLFAKEPEAMTQLMHLDSKHLYGGKLQCEGDAPDEDMDLITQRTNDVETLMKEAKEVQPLLRSKIAPEDVWLTTAGAAAIPSRFQVCDSIEVSGCRVARRALCSERVAVDGLLAYADEALDPGAKRRARVMEKATFKYQDQWGRPQFDRVRDIARVALQFDTAEALLRVLPRIYDAFEVVEVENRFANPTALGWMDITLLVRMKLASGETHVAELQVQLKEFANERREAHKHYKTIREVIPSMGVRAEHVDAVQRLILDAIEGPGKRRASTLSTESGKVSESTGAGSRASSKSSASPSVPSLDSIVPCGLPSAVVDA